MTPRRRRMTLVFGIVAGVGIAGALALNAFRSNVTFFFDPSQVSQGQVKAGEHFRLGGMVTQGSVKRLPGSLEVRFTVTDFKHDVPVSFTGVLPDLFREGTGVVAHGHMGSNGMFVADEVLAKHDEKYMPPEVARSLKRRHGEARDAALDAPAGPATGAGMPAPAASGGAQPATTQIQQPAASGGAQGASPATTSTATSSTGSTVAAGAQGSTPATTPDAVAVSGRARVVRGAAAAHALASNGGGQ